MKLAVLAALMLIAACAAPRTYSPSAGGSRSKSAPERIPSAQSPATNTFSQDAYECEREAALTGAAGGKAEVFNRCMKTRGH